MARALGIDPGTKSFDLVVVEEDRVVWEDSIETRLLADNPYMLVEKVLNIKDLDMITGPSGYGTPIICNNEIIDPETFAYEILLLSSREVVEKGVRENVSGIRVYKALADIVKEFWIRRLNVCYIPSIILLPTIPNHRKLNKIDMGTADKLAVTVAALYDHVREYGLEYSEASFILVEMGFGYNAVIGVDKGRVVDGYGGTISSMGFLTIGYIDAEAVALGSCWNRYDVFYGGVSTICSVSSIEEALEKRIDNQLCSDAFKAMYEELVKKIYAISRNIDKPREIILSGRMFRYEAIYDEITRYLEEILPTRRLKGLPGARFSKEAGQGYAIIGEGLANGFFREMIKYMGILDAHGTVLDWSYHPRLARARERIRKAYNGSVSREKVSQIL